MVATPILHTDASETSLLQEQTQDQVNEQDMYDAQESIQDEEESDRELRDCLPMSCVTLTREYKDLIEKDNRERCFEETRVLAI